MYLNEDCTCISNSAICTHEKVHNVSSAQKNLMSIAIIILHCRETLMNDNNLASAELQLVYVSVVKHTIFQKGQRRWSMTMQNYSTSHSSRYSVRHF